MENLRISLIGPGDIEFNYKSQLGLSEKKINSELEKIADVFVKTNSELELLPDKGVSFELAKLYKQKGGKKVIGVVPKSDNTFGIKHLEKYINEKVDSKDLFDKIIDSGDWFKHDLIKGLLGDVLLYLGESPGTDGEFNYAVYLYKLTNGMKKYVDSPAEKIHKEIKAGKNIPYTILFYKPFFERKLSKTQEAYLKKFGINFYYVKNPNELKGKLEELRS